MVENAPHPLESMSEADLLDELAHLLATRVETLRHGSDSALDNSSRRQRELEVEYRRRRPEREVSPDRVRPG